MTTGSVEPEFVVFRNIEGIMNELPLGKEQIETILNIRLGVPDASSTPYFNVFKSSSPDYASIEARLSKSDDDRGMIILNLKTPIPFSEFESIFGDDYSIMAHAPEDPKSASYSYDKKCKLSFGMHGNRVIAITIDWIQ